MKFGLVMFPTDYAIDPVTLGRAAEEHGFESLWFPEHTHIPTSRQTPWPGGAELPEEYRHTLDPFVALGAVAAVTSRLGLGCGGALRRWRRSGPPTPPSTTAGWSTSTLSGPGPNPSRSRTRL